MASLPDAPVGVYEEFADAAAEFRILHLHPGKYHTPVECDLEIVKRADKPIYAALSYTWGPVDGGKPITVNGKKLLVTSNCESALRHIRQEDNPTTLWIDAICIEQSNLEEKSAQIGQMRHVYQYAAEVIVWLGEAGLCTSAALDPLTTPFFDSCQKMIVDWECISDILGREWFQRIWIIQEVLLANKITFHCGNIRLPLTFLNRALQSYCQGAAQFRSYLSGTGWRVTRAVLLRNEWTSLRNSYENVVAGKSYRIGDRSLEYLLATFSPWRATVSLDKVNALLGLSSEHAVPELQPDYNKSTSQVFANVVKYFITHKQRLSILGQCQNPPECPDLPSWVPDWTRNHIHRAQMSATYRPTRNANATRSLEDLLTSPSFFSIPCFECEGVSNDSVPSDLDFHASLDVPAESWFSSKPESLVVSCSGGPNMKPEETMGLKGIALDTVQSVTDSVNRPTELDGGFDDLDLLLEWEMFAILQMPPEVKCPYGGLFKHRLEAFWRTISTDRICQDKTMPRATPLCRQLFEHWRANLMRTARPRRTFTEGSLDPTDLVTNYDGMCSWNDLFSVHFYKFSQRDSSGISQCSPGKCPVPSTGDVQYDPGLLHDYERWTWANSELEPLMMPSSTPLVDSRIRHAVLNFDSTVRFWCAARKLARTSSGRLALVPEHTRPGDQVVLLYGGSVPYIVRVLPVGCTRSSRDKGLDGASEAECVLREHTYQFIGEAYVHGIMDGEAMEYPQMAEETNIRFVPTRQERIAKRREALKKKERIFWFGSSTSPI